MASIKTYIISHHQHIGSHHAVFLVDHQIGGDELLLVPLFFVKEIGEEIQ